MTPFARTACRSLIALATSTAALLATDAVADDAWYIGIGGGISQLVPNAEDDLDVDEKTATAATVFVGRDLDDTTSVQLQLHGLGTATLVDDREADYYAADASVLYRFLDSRDRSRAAMGVALYGRFGLGYMERDTDISLKDDAPVWFGAGAGLEFALNRNIAVRAEGLYFDTDAGAAYLAVVGRFGGSRNAPRPRDVPATVPATPAERTPAQTRSPAPDSPVPDSPARSAPTTPDQEPADRDDGAAQSSDVGALDDMTAPSEPSRPSIDDRDGDGVANADDVCLRSTRGYPVRSNGCAMFDGVLSGVTFADGGDELLKGATEQLDSLARVLSRYPDSRIELHAHTDGRGTPRDQAVLTRARLRTVGTYLVGRGVSANRLVLRSFGGSRPLDDGSLETNNRIEVLENTR